MRTLLALVVLFAPLALALGPRHVHAPAQDAFTKEVVRNKKALVDPARPTQNQLDPVESHVALNGVRRAALEGLASAAILSDAWAEGALVDCPTCDPGRQPKQTCRACMGAGHVACTTCGTPASARLGWTRAPAEVRGEYGAFLWWSWLTTYVELERDRSGFVVASGKLRCPQRGAAGHKDGKCKVCRGKDELKCAPCRGKGELKCAPCKGRGEVARACSDCGGLGQLPDPAAAAAEFVASCLWCAGGEVRACRDCVASEAKTEREAFELARAAYGAFVTAEDGLAAKRRAHLPGLVIGPCPTCDASGEVACATCLGDGEVLCANCKGAGKIDSSTGEIMCPFCSAKVVLECEDCAGEGEVTCHACDGEEQRGVACTTCSGLVWRDCAGCFRGGTHQWEVNAALLEAREDLAGARVFAAEAARRIELGATLRRLYHAVCGLDWVTAQPLTDEELDQALEALGAAATKRLERLDQGED